MALTKIDDRGLKTPIDLLDNEKIRLGTGNDLELYHDGNTYIDNTNDSCDLRIQSDTIELKASSADEILLKGVKDGAVELYHDNAKRLFTRSNGITVQGNGSGSGIDFQTDTTHRGTVWANSSNQIGFLDTGGDWAIKHTNDDSTKFYVQTNQKATIDADGLKFGSDSAAANALDDYEEGTWTPIVADASSGGNTAGSYSHQLGWYTKIGNLVNIQGRIGSADTTGLTSSHAFYIRNLPFAMESSSNRLITGSALCSNINLDSDTRTVGVLANVGTSANTWFRFFQVKDNTGWGIVPVSIVPDGNNEFLWNFTYRVA